MVANITLAVFFRYVLQNSLFWTEELSRYLMVWAGMMGAALALKDNNHIGITFVVDHLPAAAKFVARLLARLIIGAFLAILFVESLKYLATLSIQSSAALGLPMVYPYLSVTVGAALMSIENLALIVRFLMGAEDSLSKE
jgi:TRAP-type C4-dicarboxylate transport system permease small subunit